MQNRECDVIVSPVAFISQAAVMLSPTAKLAIAGFTLLGSWQRQ